eukprot:scaffold284773_cov31-Tisochrysis_lutea.AAC.2
MKSTVGSSTTGSGVSPKTMDSSQCCGPNILNALATDPTPRTVSRICAFNSSCVTSSPRSSHCAATERAQRRRSSTSGQPSTPPCSVDAARREDSTREAASEAATALVPSFTTDRKSCSSWVRSTPTNASAPVTVTSTHLGARRSASTTAAELAAELCTDDAYATHVARLALSTGGEAAIWPAAATAAARAASSGREAATDPGFSFASRRARVTAARRMSSCSGRARTDGACVGGAAAGRAVEATEAPLVESHVAEVAQPVALSCVVAALVMVGGAEGKAEEFCCCDTCGAGTHAAAELMHAARLTGEAVVAPTSGVWLAGVEAPSSTLARRCMRFTLAVFSCCTSATNRASTSCAARRAV